MKRILIYSPYYSYGHFSGWVKLMSDALSESGYEVRVFHLMESNNVTPTIKHIYRSIVNKVTSSIFPGLSRNNIYPVDKDAAGQLLYKFLNDINNSAEVAVYKPDLIIHDFLDALDTTGRNWNIFHDNFKYKWFGLHFKYSKSFKHGYAILKDDNCLGILLCSEDGFRQAKLANTNIRLGLLPDIANTEISPAKSDQIVSVLNRAKRRKIIFMGGSIGSRKNIFQWFKLIKISDPTKYFFIQAGSINLEDFNSRGKKVIKNFLTFPRENFLIIQEFIDNEGYFNELLSNSDYIYAVYKDHAESSNLIFKAAFFNVPILVSKDAKTMNKLMNIYSLRGRALSRNASYSIDYIENDDVIIRGGSSQKNILEDYSVGSFRKSLVNFIES